MKQQRLLATAPRAGRPRTTSAGILSTLARELVRGAAVPIYELRCERGTARRRSSRRPLPLPGLPGLRRRDPQAPQRVRGRRDRLGAPAARAHAPDLEGHLRRRPRLRHPPAPGGRRPPRPGGPQPRAGRRPAARPRPRGPVRGVAPAGRRPGAPEAPARHAAGSHRPRPEPPGRRRGPDHRARRRPPAGPACADVDASARRRAEYSTDASIYRVVPRAGRLPARRRRGRRRPRGLPGSWASR